MEGNDNIFGTGGAELQDGQFEDTNEENTVEEQEQQEESTPDGQVEETIEGEEEGQEEEQQEEPLIDGKFKSVDDLLKSYKSLQAEYTRVRQQTKSAPKEEQPKENNVEEYEQQLTAWYNETLKTDPVKANATLAQYMAQKEFNAYKEQFEKKFEPIVQERETETLIKNTASKFKDFFEYEETMASEIDLIGQEEPDLLKSPKLYEIAYQRAKIKDLETKMMAAFENGKKSAIQNKQAKQKISNEKSKSSKENDELPPGINIIPSGDGIFL